MPNELAETMAAVFEELVGTPPPEGKGDAAVVWYLKAQQSFAKQISDIKAAHEAEVNQSAMHAATRLGVIDRQVLWLDELMLATVESVTKDRIAWSGKKSFNWLGGVCSFKKQQDQYEWPDNETELISWCNANNVNFNTRLTIDKKAIKDHIKATGEVPPGVTVTPGVEKFYVKPAPLALPSEQPKLLGTA